MADHNSNINTINMTKTFNLKIVFHRRLKSSSLVFVNYLINFYTEILVVLQFFNLT